MPHSDHPRLSRMSGGGQNEVCLEPLCFQDFAGFLKKCNLRGDLRGKIK